MFSGKRESRAGLSLRHTGPGGAARDSFYEQTVSPESEFHNSHGSVLPFMSANSAKVRAALQVCGDKSAVS